MKCSFGISNTLEEISSLSHSIVFPLFLCINHWGKLCRRSKKQINKRSLPSHRNIVCVIILYGRGKRKTNPSQRFRYEKTATWVQKAGLRQSVNRVKNQGLWSPVQSESPASKLDTRGGTNILQLAKALSYCPSHLTITKMAKKTMMQKNLSQWLDFIFFLKKWSQKKRGVT